VTGRTYSPGWISGGFDTTFNGGLFDTFVAKITDPPPTFTRRDVALFALNFGRTSGATAFDGDVTDDGRVDLADLAFVQRHLAPAQSPSASPSAEPLPTARHSDGCRHRDSPT
jgi:hypothetical protein